MLNNDTLGEFSAAFAPYVDVGGSPDPEVMIEIRNVAPGVVGNTAICAVLNSLSKTCGILLNNPNDNWANFRGGCDGTMGGTGATTTFIWSPLASELATCDVRGYDAASAALNPVAYQADVVIGQGWLITHDATVTGTEQLVFAIRDV